MVLQQKTKNTRYRLSVSFKLNAIETEKKEQINTSIIRTKSVSIIENL